MAFEMNNKEETGIYVVCSDENLLETINGLLKKKGILSITDSQGKTHYVVEGRKSPIIAAEKLEEFFLEGEERRLNELESNIETYIQININNVLTKYGFDLALMGTKAIIFTMRSILINEKFSNMSSKEIMSIAAESMGSSYFQAERNIRYAISKSSFGKKGKTQTVIRFLAEETRKNIFNKER